MDRRMFAFFECIQNRVDVQVKREMKFPVAVVEIAGLPDLGGLITQPPGN